MFGEHTSQYCPFLLLEYSVSSELFDIHYKTWTVAVNKKVHPKRPMQLRKSNYMALDLNKWRRVKKSLFPTNAIASEIQECLRMQLEITTVEDTQHNHMIMIIRFLSHMILKFIQLIIQVNGILFRYSHLWQIATYWMYIHNAVW